MPTPVAPLATPPAAPTREFTPRAVLTGIVLGAIFGASNAYIGLRVGMTISSSIPAAVLTVVMFRALRMNPTILEANMSQTVASASTALATGTIFTIPALYMWGLAPTYLQMVTLCFLGALLGIAAMVPLRRSLIVEAHAELPYPEGAACAEVLKTISADQPAGATTADSAAPAAQRKGGAWIFAGMAVGFVIYLLIRLAFVAPREIAHPLFASIIPNFEFALEISPALIAVGFILGYRQSAIVVAGAILASFVLTPLISIFGKSLAAPLYPETKALISQMDAGSIWSKYVRYIGAGAVAFAGFATVLRHRPSMWSSFKAVSRRAGKGAASSLSADATQAPRADRDLPGWLILLAIGLVVLLPIIVPGIFSGHLTAGQRALCALGVAFFGVMFVAVAARIVGIVGVTSQPTSGIILLTLIGIATTFAYLGWTGPGMQAAVLTVGTIVGIAASKSGDISQDMKTGYLVGATPYLQQAGQLLGAATACWAVAGTMLLLSMSNTFGSDELKAPQAMLMRTIIDGVLGGSLPWNLVLSGVGISLTAMLCGVGGLAFAIGVYLSLGSMLPVYIGGCVRALADRRHPHPTTPAEESHAIAESETNPGILAASGLVAGEGLAGVFVAAITAYSKSGKAGAASLASYLDEKAHPWMTHDGAKIVALLLTAAACLLLYVATRSTRRDDAPAA